jgi:hypothetical protein
MLHLGTTYKHFNSWSSVPSTVEEPQGYLYAIFGEQGIYNKGTQNGFKDMNET